MESFKNVVVALIVSVALVICSFIIKLGIENSGRMGSAESFTLYGYEGVLYRLNNVNGRLDVLVPSNEAALLFPVGQFQLPRADAKLSDQEKTSLSKNIQTISQYIQSERARSLGLAPEAKQGSQRNTSNPI